MSEFFADIRIVQTMDILFISFMLALAIAGICIQKTCFFDKRPYADKKRDPSIVFMIGKFLTIIGFIAAAAGLLVFIWSLFID